MTMDVSYTGGFQVEVETVAKIEAVLSIPLVLLIKVKRLTGKV
jgi:hypothetical protein